MTTRKSNERALVKRVAVEYAAEESIRKLDEIYSRYNDFQTLLMYLQAFGALRADYEDEAMQMLFALLSDCDEAGLVCVIKTLLGEDSKYKKKFMDSVEAARKKLIQAGINGGYDITEKIELIDESAENAEVDDITDIADIPCDHCMYFFTRACSGLEEGVDNDE